MLYDPQRFEPLTETPWDEARVHAGIADIVAVVDEAFDERELWRADEWDRWQTPTPLTTLYVGAAGVIWALHALRERGLAQTRLELPRAAERMRERWLEEPNLMRGVELPEPARAGLLNGQTGLLAVSYLVDPSESLADELLERVRENVVNARTGVMWGSPGTMLVARLLYDRTADERWREAWRESATRLLEARDEAGSWEQRLYGESFHGLGALYGLAGNVLSLLDRREWLEDEALVPQTLEILRREAVHENGRVNWPSSAGRPLAGEDGELRLQWCSGAPGIVSVAAGYLDDELVLAGAETVWQAGAHRDDKGPSLCHGTAGNGYALLATFGRTQDDVWLERARRFAVHALEQAAAARARRGGGRFSLWTGDAGVAMFAADCLLARTRYPVLETWS